MATLGSLVSPTPGIKSSSDAVSLPICGADE